jgi:geranylgeranyl diphosphate synthase type II
MLCGKVPFQTGKDFMKTADLESYFKERKAIVDAALDTEMPAQDVPPQLLHKAMRYCVFPGGKRIRPVICLAAAEAVRGSVETALLPALALELLHTYTLVHDDLPCMDDDNTRRGKPTCHVAFGEANAILVGDALQAMAFAVLAKTPVSSSYTHRQLVAELSHAAGSQGVVGGQVEDLAVGNERPTADMIELIHRHKTADLFSASARLGGITGSADENEMGLLTAYGLNLGLAFQVVDDLLDANERDGGPKGDDRKKNLSCLSVYSPEEALGKAQALVDTAVVAAERLEGPGVGPLIALARFVVERTL